MRLNSTMFGWTRPWRHAISICLYLQIWLIISSLYRFSFFGDDYFHYGLGTLFCWALTISFNLLRSLSSISFSETATLWGVFLPELLSDQLFISSLFFINSSYQVGGLHSRLEYLFSTLPSSSFLSFYFATSTSLFTTFFIPWTEANLSISFFFGVSHAIGLGQLYDFVSFHSKSVSSAASVLLVLRFPSFWERSLRVLGLLGCYSSIFFMASLASSTACFKPYKSTRNHTFRLIF